MISRRKFQLFVGTFALVHCKHGDISTKPKPGTESPAVDVVASTPATPADAKCTDLSGGTWVSVSADVNYAMPSFCVMKYAPSNVSGTATSQPTSLPWVSISQSDAAAQCAKLGLNYHLISNSEWMTIAANIANTASNWSGGAVGSGSLSRGHSTVHSTDYAVCPADPNDANAWVVGTCTSNTARGTFNQRRTQHLSNGSVLWDIGGNLWQWVNYNDTNKPTPADGNFYDFNTVVGSTTTPMSALIPLHSVQSWWNDSWNSDQGIGQVSMGAAGSGGALRRGASWSLAEKGNGRRIFKNRPTAAGNSA